MGKKKPKFVNKSNWYYLHCQNPISDDVLEELFLDADFPVETRRIFENSAMLFTQMSQNTLMRTINEFSEETEKLEPYILFKVKQDSAFVMRPLPNTQTSAEAQAADPPAQDSR